MITNRLYQQQNSHTAQQRTATEGQLKYAKLLSKKNGKVLPKAPLDRHILELWIRENTSPEKKKCLYVSEVGALGFITM